MSPTMAIVEPAKSVSVRLGQPEVPAQGERVQQGLGRVLVGAVARVEDVGVDPGGGLPGRAEAWWRMTSASTPIAATVSTVSRSDSPFDTDEPLALMLITSADSHLPAISNEERVRVESSKKRLTTVRPRSAGSFLTGRSWTSASPRRGPGSG